ncbi:FHA domain-containing protein [Roseibium sp.]|uniref:FHA domain-containing protein n=1 Tax=Roseibium sp. TaxID=1936156 RepID=UPI003A96A38A
MHFLFLLLFSISFSVFPLTSNAYSAEEEFYSNCDLSLAEEENALSCDFRSAEPKTVRRTDLTAAGRELKETYLSFDESDKKAAWLFLIDRSNPRRVASVKRSVELVRTLYQNADAKNLMAVASFAGDLQMHVSPGDPYVNIDERVQSIKADGAATAFYFTARQGIDILAKVDADRRALVIISDGKAEDTAYTHSDVIRKAREEGVIIYGIGLAEKATETVDLQMVERLASETGGPFVGVVGAEPLPTSFIEKFTSYLTNGGMVSAPLGDISGEFSSQLEVVYIDGTKVSSAGQSHFIAAAEPLEVPEEVVEVVELPLVGLIYQAIMPQTTTWAVENRFLAWLLLLLPLLALLLLLVLFLRRRQDEETEFTSPIGVPAEEAGDTRIASEPTPGTAALPIDEVGTHLVRPTQSFGRFESVDGELLFDIFEQNVTIGRHSENDFRLEDETVHRHHAVFHISPEKRPVITDLDTVNGVVVNGQRIEKIELSSGDIIELGDARFRFVGP